MTCKYIVTPLQMILSDVTRVNYYEGKLNRSQSGRDTLAHMCSSIPQSYIALFYLSFGIVDMR